MPSLLHEALVTLFRNRPSLAPEVLEESFDVTLPEYSEIRIEDSDLSEITPTEYRADLVVLLADGKPVLAIVVEVQLSRDAEKRRTWPVYLTALRARLNCQTNLLVVCTDPAIASWYSEPIEIGQPGFTLRPYVLGPSGVPFITDVEKAKEAPELSVLSVISHGKSEDTQKVIEMVLVGQKATSELDDERTLFYNDLMMFALGEAARKALEKLMSEGTYQYQSEFAKKYYGKGIAEGKAEGLAEGEARGKAEGKAEGEAEGKISSLLMFLSARKIDVPEESKAKIVACKDSSILDSWIQKAATISSVDELFD